MNTHSCDPLLVAIVGPTATGKSSLALGLARALRGEIVNCDSMQMVRGMDIGTAKPSRQEQATAPHHLYDRVGPDGYYSAGQYMEEARPICREIAGRGRVPLVVGGTGLYLRALLLGVFEGPGRSQEHRRYLHELAIRKGEAALHRMLARVDPSSAQRIQPTDVVRIVRALEVCHQAGRPISDLQGERKSLTGFRIVKIGIGLEREKLYVRIESRVREMFGAGLLGEVQGLIDQGFSPESKGFEAIGYRQAVSCINGQMSLEDAVESTCTDTRRYAKRQMTWFRKEPDLNWISAPGESQETLAKALELVV